MSVAGVSLGVTPLHSLEKTYVRTISANCLALAMAGALFIAAPASRVSAETATNLVCRKCVGPTDIGANAVTTKHIKNGTIKPADLSNAAKPAAGNLVGGDQHFTLTTSESIVRSITISAPAPGFVIVNASGYAITSTAAAAVVRCEITPGTTKTGEHLIYMSIPSAAPYTSDAFGATRGFPVDAGDFTVNLVCDKYTGDVAIEDSHMTAIFVPAAN